MLTWGGQILTVGCIDFLKWWGDGRAEVEAISLPSVTAKLLAQGLLRENESEIVGKIVAVPVRK